MNVERPHVIFVYGTLKRGGSNHGFMRGQAFLGEARLAAGFTLYSLGDYPGLVAAPGDHEGVRGELWALDAAGLAGLDALEGLDEGLYARVPAPLAEAPAGLDPAMRARAEMYLYLRPVATRPHIGSTWPIG